MLSNYETPTYLIVFGGPPKTLDEDVAPPSPSFIRLSRAASRLVKPVDLNWPSGRCRPIKPIALTAQHPAPDFEA